MWLLQVSNFWKGGLGTLCQPCTIFWNLWTSYMFETLAAQQCLLVHSQPSKLFSEHMHEVVQKFGNVLSVTHRRTTYENLLYQSFFFIRCHKATRVQTVVKCFCITNLLIEIWFGIHVFHQEGICGKCGALTVLS